MSLPPAGPPVGPPPSLIDEPPQVKPCGCTSRRHAETCEEYKNPLKGMLSTGTGDDDGDDGDDAGDPVYDDSESEDYEDDE